MAGGGVSEDGDPGFQIAPMVDVVFVLLLFFMASAGSQVIERELNINLPSGRTAAKPATDGISATEEFFTRKNARSVGGVPSRCG